MIRIRYDGYGAEDPDPYKNLTDPEHWYIDKLLRMMLGW
jgi:hypothetical protein